MNQLCDVETTCSGKILRDVVLKHNVNCSCSEYNHIGRFEIAPVKLKRLKGPRKCKLPLLYCRPAALRGSFHFLSLPAGTGQKLHLNLPSVVQSVRVALSRVPTSDRFQLINYNIVPHDMKSEETRWNHVEPETSAAADSNQTLPSFCSESS